MSGPALPRDCGSGGLAGWLRPRRLLSLPILGYRLLLSPWLGSACRFEPTCSRYALQALDRHGALAGSYLAARRILRCHPLCAGGCDPVPQERPPLFRHLLPQATQAEAPATPVTATPQPPAPAASASHAAAPAAAASSPSLNSSSGPLS